MSTANHMQLNISKNKGSQHGGSASNTPPSAGNNGMAPQQPPPAQSTSPPVNNAPKYGTLVPNRVFVGGISANTTEVELAQLFSAYGTVKATKIISDRAGVSKGYGFVTFESEEEAKRLQRESDNIMLRERRLNIAPAIKKQPFSRTFEVSSPPPNAANQTQFYYAAGGVPYAYQNGMAYYTPAPQTTGANGDLTAQPLYQAPPVYATPTAAPPSAPYPMPMYPPQPLFVHQQYPYQPIPYDPQQYYAGGGGNGQSAGPQYLYGGGPGGGSGAQAPMAPQQQQQCSSATSASVAGSSSPPRHGYYQQLTAYNSDGMYYNMPMYNVTIDPASGLYTTESIDPTLGGMAEVPMPQNPTSHPGGNSSQNYYQGSRRNRRHNTRRQAPGHLATPHQEIGAGDAPLHPDVADMCKKIDNLKL